MLHRPLRVTALAARRLRAESLLPISLHDEVEVGLPAFAQPVERIVLDLPRSRISRRSGVTTLDPHVDVLNRYVSQAVVRWEFVEFHSLWSLHCFTAASIAARSVGQSDGSIPIFP